MNDILNNLGQSDADVLRRVIGNTFIIEMGIVKDIPEKGKVTVEMSASQNTDSVTVTDCVLASFASSSVSFYIEPAINDKVIVLFPRRYASRMFKPDVKETIVSPAVIQYGITGGIAILANQFQEDFHKNYISFVNGEMSLQLAYSGSKNLAAVNINKDGEIFLNSNATSIEINKDNEIAIDTGKAKIEIDKNGNVSIDAVNGKISVKNNNASLFTLLTGIVNILNTSLVTKGSPTDHTVVPGQFADQVIQLNNLLQ